MSGREAGNAGEGPAGSPARSWAILTGEYPPQPGGVSDYTRLVAQHLAAAGDDVQVWAPSESVVGAGAPAGEPAGADGPAGGGVHVHRLPDHFGPRGLAVLGRELDRRPAAGRRILVQYVPHGFGCKAMNLAFCAWLLARGRREAVWTLFHEVAYPIAWGQPPRHNFLGAVNRAMALLVARASRRAFVTTPAWERTLGPLLRPGRRVEWLPVPATLPTRADAGLVAAVRARLLSPVGVGGGAALVGHFGTFGIHVAALLSEVVPPLLGAGRRRRAVLVGRGGTEFAASLAARHPGLTGCLVATGDVGAAEAAAHLAACDLVVQPYPDGVSCRRTSVMASLALGTPVVSSRGHLTEPIWADSGAVALAPDPTPGALVRVAERALGDPTLLRHLAAAGRALYDTHFDVRRVIEVLRGDRPGMPPGPGRKGRGRERGHGA